MAYVALYSGKKVVSVSVAYDKLHMNKYMASVSAKIGSHLYT